MRGPALLLALALMLPAQTVPAGAADDPAAPSADPTQVRAGDYRLDPDHAKITWSVSHLGFSTYYGQITDVAGTAILDPKDPARSRLAVTIGIASVTGANPRLDAHLKAPAFFDAARFPTATFAATRIEPTSPTTARVTGDLTLRGVTRPVSFDATFNQAGIHPVDRAYTVGFDGRTVLKRSDFGIDAFLPALGDDVVLRLEAELKAVP